MMTLPGLALFYGGLVQARNLLSVLMHCCVIAALCLVLWLVAGYAIANDVSERAFQSERAGQWTKGKSCDTFGPLGPWLVTRDEIADPQNLDMTLDVNGQRFQTGNTKTMIFGCAHLVAYLSTFMTLFPGDVISTGTPPGVGMGIKPDPVYLKAGDEMHLTISGLGEQRTRCVAWSR